MKEIKYSKQAISLWKSGLRGKASYEVCKYKEYGVGCGSCGPCIEMLIHLEGITSVIQVGKILEWGHGTSSLIRVNLREYRVSKKIWRGDLYPKEGDVIDVVMGAEGPILGIRPVNEEPEKVGGYNRFPSEGMIVSTDASIPFELTLQVSSDTALIRVRTVPSRVLGPEKGSTDV